MITKHFHLDYDKYNKEHMKRLGEYYRSITAKFSDKEMEEAIQIGLFIIDRLKPEDGLSYAEIAMVLWGPREGTSLEHLPEEYQDIYVSKINRLLFCLQMIAFEFVFNTTMEPQGEGRRTIPIIPCVRSAKIKEYDKSFPMIFNAAGSEYAYEVLEELGIYKLKSNDYARVNIPHPLSKEEREYAMILNDLKGVGNRHIDEYAEELIALVERIADRFSNLGESGILETDLMSELIPESRDKSGNDLEPYKMKFNDAMYMFFKGTEDGKYKRTAERYHAEWKRDHGYLEGK
jgi:hypothetical protein